MITPETGVINDSLDTTRQHLEELLQESEERFRLVADATPVMIWMAGADKLCNYFNRVWLEFTGSSLEQQLGNGWTQNIHLEDKQRQENIYSAAFDTRKKFQIEYRLRRADGKYRWLLDTGVPRFTPHGRFVGFIGSCVDITERKQAEEKLRQKTAEQQAIMQALSAVYFRLDSDGTILDYSARYNSTLYLSPEAFLGKPIQDVLPSSMREQFQESFVQVLQSQTLLNIEYLLPVENREELFLVTLIHLQEQQIIVMIREIPTYASTESKLKPIGMGEVVKDSSKCKGVEAALQESEERFRAIFDQAAIGISLTDLNGSWLLVNQKFCDLVGYTQAEMRLQTVQEMTHPEDVEMSLEYIRQLLAGEIQTFSTEKRYLHKEGYEVWVNLSVSLVLSPTGEPKYMIGVVQDIRDRKALEKELTLRQARFDAFFTHAPVGLEIIDDQMRFVYINETLAAMDGCSVAEHVGKTITEILPEMASDLEATYRHILTTGESILYLEETGETPKEPGVQRHWISSRFPLIGEEDKPIAVGGVTFEITKRKRAEECLRQSEERYRKLAQQKELLYCIASQIRNSLNLDTILETAVTEIRSLLHIDRCLFIWYRVHGESAAWEVVHEAKSAELSSILGCYPGEALATLVQPLVNLEVLRVDDVQDLQDETTRKFFQSLGFKSLLNLPIHTPSGEVGVVACINYNGVRPWTEEEVELLCAVCDQLAIAINQAELYAQSRAAATVATEKATQLELALHSLQQTQAQLIQTEKMSSLGQLVAGIAHEINNPVSFIYGNVDYVSAYVKDLLNFLELYRTAYPQPLPDIQALAEAIDLDFLVKDLPKVLFSMKVGADRIRDLVLSLRNFSRLDEAEKKPVDIHEGLDNTLLILQHRLKQKPAYPSIQVLKKYGQLPLVNCYPGQLNQVFMNLLTNAIDALELHSSRDNSPNQNPEIQISTQVNDLGYITINIADNGPGMTQAVLSRLFDPFFTTKPTGKGIGLGLSISYQIVVEKHKGTLHYHSELGKGTKLTITLPRWQNSYSDS